MQGGVEQGCASADFVIRHRVCWTEGALSRGKPYLPYRGAEELRLYSSCVGVDVPFVDGLFEMGVPSVLILLSCAGTSWVFSKAHLDPSRDLRLCSVKRICKS